MSESTLDKFEREHQIGAKLPISKIKENSTTYRLLYHADENGHHACSICPGKFFAYITLRFAKEGDEKKTICLSCFKRHYRIVKND